MELDVTPRMLPLDNVHLKNLDKPTYYQQFHGICVDKMTRSRMLVEICFEIGKGYDHSVISARYFNQKRKLQRRSLENGQRL